MHKSPKNIVPTTMIISAGWTRVMTFPAGNHKSEKYSRKKANSENAEKGICQIKGIIIFFPFIIIAFINDNCKLFYVFIYIYEFKP